MAILIVEFAKEEHATGESLVKSAVVATRERFRAVLMTAFTFILGVLPMLWASGAGSGSRRSLGVPVFWGMVWGTLFGFVFVPLLYVLVQKIVDKIYHKEEKKMLPDYSASLPKRD